MYHVTTSARVVSTAEIMCDAMIAIVAIDANMRVDNVMVIMDTGTRMVTDNCMDTDMVITGNIATIHAMAHITTGIIPVCTSAVSISHPTLGSVCTSATNRSKLRGRIRGPFIYLSQLALYAWNSSTRFI